MIVTGAIRLFSRKLDAGEQFAGLIGLEVVRRGCRHR